MTLTQAELNAMNRVTPTGLAEQAYAARQPRRLTVTRGPAGIDIPDPRSVYRPTIDPPLLTQITRAASAAYWGEQLPYTWSRQVTVDLAGILEQRYPPADMAVLAKYGFAGKIAAIVVDMSILGPHRLPLDVPILVPAGAAHFTTSERGSGLLVPAPIMPFFDRLRDVKRTQSVDFAGAGFWSSKFKAREGRWPTWAEIEAAWPRLGAWMAGQRKAAADVSGIRGEAVR